MKTETREIYRCEYCKKVYLIKKACEIHETRCTKNPENFRACFGCYNTIKKEVTIYYDHYDGEHEYQRELLYCKAKDIFIYPPIIEHKGNAIDLGDKINEPMPKECDKFKDEFF